MSKPSRDDVLRGTVALCVAGDCFSNNESILEQLGVTADTPLYTAAQLLAMYAAGEKDMRERAVQVCRENEAHIPNDTSGFSEGRRVQAQRDASGIVIACAYQSPQQTRKESRVSDIKFITEQDETGLGRIVVDGRFYGVPATALAILSIERERNRAALSQAHALCNDLGIATGDIENRLFEAIGKVNDTMAAIAELVAALKQFLDAVPGDAIGKSAVREVITKYDTPRRQSK